MSLILERFHAWNLKLEAGEQSQGFKISRHYGRSSVAEFKAAWKEDGIYAFRYVGHGSQLGLIVDPSIGATVRPDDVHPPYKLAIVELFACYSADGVVSVGSGPKGTDVTYYWRMHVSDKGLFVGYCGYAYVWSTPVYQDNNGKPIP